MEYRKEEDVARKMLEKYIYPAKSLQLLDKPDIQSSDGSVGIEHRYITTEDARMQDQFMQNIGSAALNAEDAMKFKCKYKKADFSLLCDKDGNFTGTLGSLTSHAPLWKVQLFKEALIDKLGKLNSGNYATFEEYCLFFTLDRYWVTEEEIGQIRDTIDGIQNQYPKTYSKIYLLTPSSLYAFNSRTLDIQVIRNPYI